MSMNPDIALDDLSDIELDLLHDAVVNEQIRRGRYTIPVNHSDHVKAKREAIYCPVAEEKTQGRFFCTRGKGHEGPCAVQPLPFHLFLF